jgi:hypothetical protein
VANSKIMWKINQCDTHDKTILQRLQSEGRARRKVHSPDKHRKRSKTRLRHVSHAIPYHNRLDIEKGNRQQKWNNMEIAEQIGRYRVFRRCVFTNRKEKPYAEEITKTGGRGLKNRVENKRQ